MNSAVSPQQLHANLMIAIDTVDSTALTGIIRALRVIIEARKGELDTAEAELQGRGARGNFREIASNRPRKRSAFGNCTKIGGLWGSAPPEGARGKGWLRFAGAATGAAERSRPRGEYGHEYLWCWWLVSD